MAAVVQEFGNGLESSTIIIDGLFEVMAYVTGTDIQLEDSVTRCETIGEAAKAVAAISSRPTFTVRDYAHRKLRLQSPVAETVALSSELGQRCRGLVDAAAKSIEITGEARHFRAKCLEELAKAIPS